MDLPVVKSGQELLVAALGDETSPRDKNYEVPANVDKDYAATIRALYALRPVQRAYCKALIESRGRQSRAYEILQDKMYSVDRTAVWRWHKKPDFVRAVELVKKQCLRMADADPTSLMLKASEVIDGALEPHPIMDKHGNVVGHDVDHAAAMRGIEWLGKVHRMTEETQSNRMVLELKVNLATREDVDPVRVTQQRVIEGEFTESDD